MSASLTTHCGVLYELVKLPKIIGVSFLKPKTWRLDQNVKVYQVLGPSRVKPPFTPKNFGSPNVQNLRCCLNHIEDPSPIAGLTLCRLKLTFIIDGRLVFSQPSVSVNTVSNSVLRKLQLLQFRLRFQILFWRDREKIL